jgi:hypothetical protein
MFGKERINPTRCTMGVTVSLGSRELIRKSLLISLDLSGLPEQYDSKNP